MDGAEGNHPDSDRLAAQRLVGHQVDRLYGGLPAILVNLAVMPVVVGVAFWGSVSSTALAAWVVASLVVLALRYALMKAYQRRPSGAEDALRWANRFTLTSLASGLLWGAAGWAFFTPESAALQVFLYTSLVGLAAGSIIVTSYWLPAYFAFAVPSVGLAALRLVMEGGAEYISLAFLMGMYLVIITRVARVQHAAGQSLVRLRDENVDLVERLSAEKSAVEAANHELDQRVRERTAELLEEVEVRKAAEHRLEHLAHHDPLTGLPNRLAFGHQLDRAIAQASRRQRRLALLFIDLDRFKEVNDSAGHNVGDRLLQAVAERLAYNLRLSDSLSRLGGDEFVCLLEDVVDGREAMRVADKMLALLAGTFDVAGHEVHLSGSIGICVFPEDGTDRETLVRNADTAMFRAKAEGRGRSHFYTPEMTEAARRRLQMDAALRRARGRRTVPPLPDQGGSRGKAGRRRGAAALAQRRIRAGSAIAVHSIGRGHRTHRPPRRMGAAGGLPSSHALARARAGPAVDRGEPLGKAAGASGIHGPACRRGGGQRLADRSSRTRDHRVDDHGW